MKTGFGRVPVRRVSTVALAAMSLSLSGCGGYQLARPQAKATAPAAEIEITEVTLTCQRTGASAVGLPIMLAGLAVDTVTGMIKGLLEDAQKKRNAVWSAVGISDDCVPAEGKTTAGELRLVREVRNRDGRPIANPGFDLTGRVVFERVGTGDKAKIQARFAFNEEDLFRFGRTAAPTRGRGRKHVVVLIALTENTVLKGSATTGTEEIGTPLRLDFGYLRDGSDYNGNMLRHVRSAALLPVPTAGKWMVTAIVFETEDELLALKALTAAYGDGKSLGQALRDLLGIKDK